MVERARLVQGDLLTGAGTERFAVVADLLERSGVPWRKRSAMGQAGLRPGEMVLLDSMGELAHAIR